MVNASRKRSEKPKKQPSSTLLGQETGLSWDGFRKRKMIRPQPIHITPAVPNMRGHFSLTMERPSKKTDPIAIRARKWDWDMTGLDKMALEKVSASHLPLE